VELVGRGGELGALRRALDRASAGRRTVVAVRGEAGIGKTSVLSELRSEAARRHAAVLTTAVTNAETAIGWAGLATLLNGYESVIAALPPAQRDALLAATGHGGEAHVEPLTVAASLAELLRRCADEHPVVVVVDDVHWLDPATAAALSFAIRLHADVSILFVLAARLASIPLDLARLVDPATPDDLVILEPAPLSVGGVFEVLHQRFGLQLGRIELVRLHDLTGGNPLHVIETGRLLADGVPLAEALVPASLADAIDVQLARLTTVHVPVLQAAALMPTIDLDRLNHLHPAPLVESAVTEAESLDVVRMSGSHLTFRHPLLQAGLARRLGTVERRTLHRRLASLSSEPEVRAHHLSEAAQGYDEDAAEVLEAAARAAATRGLPVQAAHHALRSFELTDAADIVRCSRRRMLAADAAFDGGDPRRALDLLLPIVDAETTGDDHLAALKRIATATAATAGAEACVPWIQRLVDESERDSELHARAHIMLSRAVLFDDIAAAALVADGAVAAARAAGSSDALDDANAARLIANFLAGRPVNLDHLLDSASLRFSTNINTISSMAGEMLVWSDRLDEAVVILARELETHQSSGSIKGELETTSQLIDVNLRRGDFATAAALIDRSLALAQAAGFDRDVVLRSADRAVLAALRGDPHRGITEAIDAAGNGLSKVERAQLDATLGYADLVSGDQTAAATRLQAAHSTAERIGLADLGGLPYRGNLVEALVAVGRVDDAKNVAESVTVTAARAQRGRGDAEARRARAMVLAAMGELAEADAAAADAVSAFENLPLPIEQGRALLLAGNIARRRKQRARAGELLRAADALFVPTGALAYSRRVHAELDRLGAPTTNELTATETQIAALVVAGRRNDEIAAELFVTRRTVESNLTRIYRKLGVRSRTELAAHLRNG
jgi:DNA-binding CsgD family transcriptional regulator